jgi:hypothetical protein
MARGQVVRLPQRPETRYRVSDGLGQLVEGTLDEARDLALNTPGEWIVQIYDDGGDLARFPLYVDRETPRVSVLPAGGGAVANGIQAQERAFQLYKTARAHYETPAPTTDPLLQAAAERALSTPTDDAQALALGLSGADEIALGARVSGSDVEDCIDRLLYDPRYRAAFVAPAPMGAAFAARLQGGRVELVAVFVGRKP